MMKMMYMSIFKGFLCSKQCGGFFLKTSAYLGFVQTVPDEFLTG